MEKITTLTDTQLLEAIRQDDQKAFLEVYNRYWDKMVVVAANRLGNAEEAEECVQDVFVKLWNFRETLELQHDSFSYYLSRAVRNHAFDILDKNYRQRQRAAGYVPEIRLSPSIESEFIAKELKARIDLAINELPPQCQLVFKLHADDGLTVKAIADKLDLSENTVKSHLKKAKKDIRDTLEVFGPVMAHMVIQYYLHAG